MQRSFAYALLVTALVRELIRRAIGVRPREASVRRLLRQANSGPQGRAYRA